MTVDIASMTGPVQQPASGGPAKQIVVLLHGLGSDGNDLIALAPHLASVLPDAVFVSPNAPQKCDMAPFGYQWFSLQSRVPDDMLNGIQQSAPLLDAFLDAQLETYGLTDEKMALLGFSQGTMMSLYVAPRRKARIAGVVGFSGALLGGEGLKEEGIQKPPILLVHGNADEVVPPAAMGRALTELEEADFQVEAHMHPGLGHGIDPQGMQRAAQFLTGVFGV